MVLDTKSAKIMDYDRQKDCNDARPKKWPTGDHTGIAELKCHFCDKTNHLAITNAKGNTIIPYVCQMFVNTTPEDRFSRLKSKNVCTQCLCLARVGAKHKCLYLKVLLWSFIAWKILINHTFYVVYTKMMTNNVKLLAQFKEKFIENCKTPLPLFSRQISCFSDIVGISKFPAQLQTIEIQGVKLNLFFDSGCGDMIVKKSAVEKLAAFGGAKQIVSQPIVLSGVGDQKFVCNKGACTVCLPLFSGENALLTGLCLPKITTEFPTYHLGSVENEIRKNCKQQN